MLVLLQDVLANLGDSRAYLAVAPPPRAAPALDATAAKDCGCSSGSIGPCALRPASTSLSSRSDEDEPPQLRAVLLSKEQHTALDPKERKRIEAAGGAVENGRMSGVLEVSRSFGDRRFKRGGNLTKGAALSVALPEVASFPIGPEQLFVLLGCDGVWKAFSGIQAVEFVHRKLRDMDGRRVELATVLDDPATAASMTREAVASLRSEREGANEEGCLRSLLHDAVHMRHAKDNCSVLLIRFR